MNRRQLLQSLSCGFGYLALRNLAANGIAGAATLSAGNPLAPKAPMFPAKAKRVIFLYMQGAPSQYETFDYSPDLAAAKSKSLMAPACKFTPSGQSGIPISDFFPNLQKHADDLCLLNGMTTDSPPTSAVIRYEFPQRDELPPVALTWYDIGEPMLIHTNPGEGGRQYGVCTLLVPSSGARLTVDGVQAAGKAVAIEREGRPFSTCCLAFSESWTEAR